MMSEHVGSDHLILIRIAGMHCHKCEQAIQNSLMKYRGVHEVEVDFASGQASVLYDRKAVSIDKLLESVRQAGYEVVDYLERE
jgi:copper chaperone CopZ